MKTGDFPKYAIPFDLVVGLAFDVLSGGKRSFHEDAVRCIRRLKPPLQVIGEASIPVNGPCVVTVNHYYRPGFDAWWIALAIAAVVPVEMHWVITGELLYLGELLSPISRWALVRIANAYGFTTMPPMPPRPRDVEGRARSVKQILDLMKRNRSTVLGLAPEGMDQRGGRLSPPASGVGRFGLLLAGLGSTFLPVGAYEADGAFCLNFGLAYHLEPPTGLLSDEKDRTAACTIMEKIAEMLPERLRGAYA